MKNDTGYIYAPYLPINALPYDLEIDKRLLNIIEKSKNSKVAISRIKEDIKNNKINSSCVKNTITYAIFYSINEDYKHYYDDVEKFLKEMFPEEFI